MPSWELCSGKPVFRSAGGLPIFSSGKVMDTHMHGDYQI